MSRQLAVVSFDAVSTLIKPGGGGVGRQYASAAKHFLGTDFDANALQSSFVKEFKLQRSAFPNYGYHQNMTDRQWWTQVVVATFKGVSSGKSFSDKEYEPLAFHLFDNFEWDLYPNVREMLYFLKNDKKLALCVISNFDQRLLGQGGVLETKEIASYFDLVLTSRGVGVEKPDARIFNRVIRHFEAETGSSIAPEQILHVGDDVICDYDAAKSVGMKALLIDHRRIMTKTEWVCNDLFELQHKIDQLVASEHVID